MIAALCLLLPVFGGCGGFTQQVTTPGNLLASRDSTVRMVRVTATVKHMSHRISRAGFPYDVFLICDEKCVRVYRRDRTAAQDGDRVSVTGRYFREHHVGNAVYRNELDADEVIIEQ